MSQITVEKTNGENIFEILRDDWRKLFAATESSPFLSWEWLSTWYKWFGNERTPFILKAFRGNHLIGLMPLCLQEKKVLGIKVRRLSFIGEEVGGADYLDFIAQSENKSEVLSAFFDFLRKEENFDVINLENLSSDSATAQYLHKLYESKNNPNLRYSNKATYVCPKINLKDGWESVLRNSKRASNFKRRFKQLEKMSGFEFRSITSPSETAEAFERFYKLHEKRWSKNGGSELSGHPQLVSFQRDLVLALSSTGLLRFDEVWVEGECRSSVYGLDDGRTFYYYNSGYDADWAKYSVGLVLIGLSVKSSIERGNEIYDFLRGDETYKYDWANDESRLINLSLRRRTIPAFFYENLNQTIYNLKNFSKSALPTGLSEALKNRRREWKRNYQFSELKAEKTQ